MFATDATGPVRTSCEPAHGSRQLVPCRTGGALKPHIPPTGASNDDALADAVQRAVVGTGYSALRGIVVIAADGQVWLQGRVRKYHHKQVAQNAALAVAGLKGLRNELVVE